jgi:hypothetical protein
VHVEHAYALTGHGVQGASVEHATILATPHDLTRGWSYTALSRARATTQLLIRDTDTRERAEFAPDRHQGVHDPERVRAVMARRMLERDDQDRAINQLSPAVAGGHDDPQLTAFHDNPRAPAQEQAAARAEPAPPPDVARLRTLDTQLEELRAQLDALPLQDLGQLDALEDRVRTLSQQHHDLQGTLDRLPPAARRIGRRSDPHLLERTRLTSATSGVQAQLDHALTDRARLQRELGDPDAIRTEHDSLLNAIQTLGHEHHELLDALAQRELAAHPEWVRNTLGQRPEQRWASERWDDTAHTLARYRIRYEIPDDPEPLGPPPASDGRQARDYEHALQALDPARNRGREAPLEIDR